MQNRNEYQKEYRKKNKQILKSKKHISYLKNREEIIKKTKKYYESHKDKMTEFHKKYRASHKKQINKYRKQNLLKRPFYQKNSYLKNTYGISLEQYNEILKEQNGVCAICYKPETAKELNKKTRRLAVDHDHQTNKVRGLLCIKCNHLLGNANDNTQILLNAVNYLTKE